MTRRERARWFLEMPYGCWECRGHSVLFNRCYWPIAVRDTDGSIRVPPQLKADRNGLVLRPIFGRELHKWRRQYFFYDDKVDPPDHNAVTRERITKVLDDFLADKPFAKGVKRYFPSQRPVFHVAACQVARVIRVDAPQCRGVAL